MADVGALKKEGNRLFQARQWRPAIDKYTSAIDLWMEPADRAVLYTNRAACRLKLGEGHRALSDAERAAALAPTYVKAHFRMAAALRQLSRPSEAVAALLRLLELAPEDAAAQQALKEAPAREVYMNEGRQERENAGIIGKI